MDVKVLNNVTEAYGANFVNDAASKPNPVNSDNSVKINEEKAKERKSTDSFAEEGAILSISDNSREAASANGRIVLASEDGIVIEKEKTATENLSSVESEAEKAVNRAATEDDKVKDLTGYSQNQVETLYKQGKVSKADYDKKIEQLELLKDEVAKADTINSDNEEVIKDVANEKKEIETQNANVASDEKESKKASVQKEDKAREATREVIESNKEQSEKMSKLLQTEEDDSVKNEAYKKAEENNRVDLIDPLFNDEAKKQSVVIGNA